MATNMKDIGNATSAMAKESRLISVGQDMRVNGSTIRRKDKVRCTGVMDVFTTVVGRKT